MTLEELNLYLDAFLSLGVQDPTLERDLYIEEGILAENLTELLSEWLYLHSLGSSEALKLKLWFQLTYRQLGEVLSISEREVQQLLRIQRQALVRTRLLPEEERLVAGFSCFMIEQRLSPWLDTELEDARTQESIQAHLLACKECYSRLEEYRASLQWILRQRKQFSVIEEEEWGKACRTLKKRRKQSHTRIAASVFAVMIVCSILVWVIWAKPERIPNIYEIPD